MNYIERRKAALDSSSKDSLIDEIINKELNELVSRYADYNDDDSGAEGKRVPYIGWFWRSVDFANEDYRIGDCGEFIGFMENNKWGYPGRSLTPKESALVTAIICEAKELDGKGGALTEIIANTQNELAKLWPLLQSFPLKEDGYWITGALGNVAFAATEDEADELIRMLTSSSGPGFGYHKVPV